jgi:hypothetical protein
MPEDQGHNTSENSQEQNEANAGGEQKQEATVPSSRLREETRKRREAEQRLQQIEADNQRAEEERQQNQGEYQKLAETRLKALEKRDARIKELEGQITTDRRYRAFVGASSGLILPEAIADAFSMLTNDEWATVQDDDEDAVRLLAQNLAERKPYLAAGPRGAGSFGSRSPVFGASNGSSAGSKQNPFKGGLTKKAAYK